MAKKKHRKVFVIDSKEDLDEVLEQLGYFDCEEDDIEDKDEEEILFGNYPRDFEEDEDTEGDLPFGMSDIEYFEEQVEHLEDVLSKKNRQIDDLETTVSVLCKMLALEKAYNRF